MSRRKALSIGGREIVAGSRQAIDLPVSVLSDDTPVTKSVHAIHGRHDGPTVFVSAGVQGDEVIGIEIVRRLLRTPVLSALRGTLLVVPIINTYGFLNHSRHLPGRRDLNRSFPGSAKGWLASWLADLFVHEIVERSDHGIDLHSAAIHRTNLPRIRTSPDGRTSYDIALVFGAPVLLTWPIRDGSLRRAAAGREVEVLLYEAGGGLRFDEFGVRAGVSGILRVLRHLEMLSAARGPKAKTKPLHCASSKWVRAPMGGLLRSFRSEGDILPRGDVLGAISDPFGETQKTLHVTFGGIIIGRVVLPVVNEGDEVFHIAAVQSAERAETALDQLTTPLEQDPLFDEDEII